MNQRQTKSNQPILLALVPVLIVICAAAMNTLAQMQYMSEQRVWVYHTQEVLLCLSTIDISLKDAETSSRGFLLTGQKQYLEPYELAGDKLASSISRLETFVKDNPIQFDRSKLLKILIGKRMEIIKEVVSLAEKRQMDNALVVVRSGRGLQAMQQVSLLLSQMRSQEEGLLAERLKKVDEATTNAYGRFALLTLITVLLSICGAVMVQRARASEERERRIQDVLYSVSQILIRPIDFSEALAQSLKVLCEAVNWSAAGFWSTDGDKNALKLVAFYSTRKLEEFESASRALAFEKGQGLPGRVWESNIATWIDNVQDDDNFPRAPMAKTNGLYSAFAFPVIIGTDFLGVFEFFASSELKPDLSTMRLFDIVATELGQLILRRNMEYELIEAKGVLDSVLKGMGSGVMVVDLHGKYLVLNPAVEKIFGDCPAQQEREQWVSSWKLFLEDGKSESSWQEAVIDKVMAGASLDDLVLLGKNEQVPNGVWISLNARPLRNKGGDITGSIIVFENVSARKESEQRVSEFYSTVSHELRTPLTSIRGALGLMEGGKAGELSPRAQRLVSMGRKESERLVRLINDILDIRKIEAGKLEFKLESFDLNMLILQAVESLTSFAAEREVPLRPDLDSSLDRFMVDKDRFVQIVTNLISNAVKFSPQGMPVQIKSEFIGGSAKISVIDRGEGISKTDQHKLFKLFQQIDSGDDRQKEGTGLGLAICKALVEQHGGTIGVDSEPGHGAKFWFTIPTSAAKAVEKAIEPNAKVPSNKQVLLVEDDDSIAAIIEMNLLEEGFRVKRVSHLKEAQTEFEQNKDILAVILDLGLPDGSGLELMDTISASGNVLPVVVVTAQQHESGYSYPLLMDWITKPMEENRLLRAVQLCMTRRPAGPARVLLVEDDDSTREVFKQQLGGLQIEISEASNGEQAVSIARALNPDLIVLDLGLPGLDGFGVVTVLRHDEGLKDTPLLVYTARDLTEEDKKNLSLGLTTYLTKSRTSEGEFLSSVRTLLNGLLAGNTLND